MENFRWVLVYDYDYWDPDAEQMRRAARPATIDAIKSGLGIPVPASGRKVPANLIDSHGFFAAWRPPRQDASATSPRSS